MESLLTNTAIGTITSRVMENQGQNSQKLDIKPLKNQNKNQTIPKIKKNVAQAISGYIMRKKNTIMKSISNNPNIPKQVGNRVKLEDKVVVTNKDNNNRYNVLIDELALLEAQTLTGFVEITEEKLLSNKIDDEDKVNKENVFTDKTFDNNLTNNEFKKRIRKFRKSKNNTTNSDDSDNSGASDFSESDEETTKDVLNKGNDNVLNEAHKTTTNLSKLRESNNKTSEKIRTLRAYQKNRNEISHEDVNIFNLKVEELFPEQKGKISRFPGGMYDLNDLANLVLKPDHEIEKEKIVRFKIAETTTETSTNDVETVAEQHKLESDKELFKVPNRKDINKLVKNKKYFSAYSKLLNYLRCKTFLKFRDASLMQQLVHQANVWMVKEGYDLTDTIHYTTISSAVTIAFLISPEELQFRQSIKNKTNWDNMVHHNKTISGDLGKVFRLPDETSLFSEKLDTMAMPKQSTHV